jgi:murein DD-endopeptidase MepM/ murein hydrolase activator NlpD
VNTLFKDRIAAVKETHFRQALTAYETRLANLQRSYDDLNAALVAAQDEFKAVADDAEVRHRALASLVERKESLQASLGLNQDWSADAKEPARGARKGVPAVGGALLGPRANSAASLAPAEATPTGAAIPEKAGAESDSSSLSRLRSTLSDGDRLPAAPRKSSRAEPAVDNPLFRSMRDSQARLQQLSGEDEALLAETESAIKDDVAVYQKTIRTAGLDPKKIIGRVAAARGGTGGPEIPLSAAASGSFAEALGTLDDFTDTVTALRAVPLAAPVEGDEFDQSSGFGVRQDPFTNQLSFHSGLDFSGPAGSAVHVTAPGVVVFAGTRGAYGNTVEVDHGFGIRTRYGHLSRILVTVGTQVQKGEIIGKLGSTGRSTGPHVHYEVWYDAAVKNPSNFLKAGRYVLQAEGT